MVPLGAFPVSTKGKESGVAEGGRMRVLPPELSKAGMLFLFFVPRGCNANDGVFAF